MPTAVGFSIHTGWAAAVVVKGPPAEILAVFQIELADEQHDARFVYHAASEDQRRAEEILRAAAAIARERAERALEGLEAGTILALSPPKKKLPELRSILRSHPLLHAAEGELYRRALLEAGQALGLPIAIPAKPAPPEIGKRKPPWGKDQKAAAALAWAAITASMPTARQG
jgi:hypothetical protein